MASSRALAVVSLLLAAVAVAADDSSDTTHLSFFMHDVVSGSNPTSVQVIRGPSSSTNAGSSSGVSFGDTNVMDNALTETSSATSSEVGRMQGVYMLASQTGAAVRMVTANILFTSGDSNGSTIAVVGREDSAAAAAASTGVKELSVIGGTGKFRMANGYVLWKTAAANGPDSTVQLDVYLIAGSDGNTTVDANAPVSPVDGGSGSGSGGSSGARSSSSGNAVRVSSSAGWVVAVAAAAVGSSWVW